MTVSRDQLRKWREAYPDIDLDDAALMSVGPWPSLYVSEFVAYLSSKEADPQLISFIGDIGREVAWVYGMLTKMTRDSQTPLLLLDMLNNATSAGTDSEYSFVQRFIRDYAKANGIAIPDKIDGNAAPAWVGALEIEGG